MNSSVLLDCCSSADTQAEQLSGPALKMIVQKFDVSITYNEVILKNWKPRSAIHKYYTRSLAANQKP